MEEKAKKTCAEKLCEICCVNRSKYCCPRCNLLYCSMECYKCEKHQQCSESFYRDCVLNDLSSTENDDESRRKMLDILNRLKENNDINDIDSLSNEDPHNESESDDEQYPDLAERLSNLDLNNANLVWECLTNDERQEFESILSSGDVTKIVPEWYPWWEYKKSEKLVEEVSESNIAEWNSNCPALETGIKSLDQISANKPSPFVKYNIINVLGAYVMTVRYFIGEHQDSCLDAIICLINLSENLLNNRIFNNIIDAISSVERMCTDKSMIDCDTFTFLELQQDVKKIIKGPEKQNKMHYISSALSDIYKLLSNCNRILKSDAKSDNTNVKFSDRFMNHDDKCITPSRKDLKLYVKKIEYYLSYTTSADDFTEITY